MIQPEYLIKVSEMVVGCHLNFVVRRVLYERQLSPRGVSAHGTKQWKPNCNRQPPFDLNSPEVEYNTSRVALDKFACSRLVSRQWQKHFFVDENHVAVVCGDVSTDGSYPWIPPVMTSRHASHASSSNTFEPMTASTACMTAYSKACK